MYEFRLAWRSIASTPALSGVIIGAIGLGIGVFMILLTAYHLIQRDPLPQKSHEVYRVAVNSWDPKSPYAGGMFGQDTPPILMTYRDAMNLMKSDIPTHQAAMFASRMYLAPVDSKVITRPFQVRVRATFHGFFPMFDVPFLYGGFWNQQADDSPEPVVVLNKATNQKLFGGANSVGKTVLLDNQSFRVVGVLNDWAPMPMFYNILTLGVGVQAPEDVFIPFHFLERLQLGNQGADMGWKAWDPGFENMLQSESTWLQFWVELDNRQQKQRYMDFLNRYALDQRKLGRFQGAINNRLYDVPHWIKTVTLPLNGPSLVFLVLGLLYLVVCLANLVSMLLGKFVSRMPEVSIRRALGATRSSVFTQHLFEVSLLGVGGGILGILLSQGVLTIIRIRFGLAASLFSIDLYLLAFALGLALVSGIAAGLVPAWRACSTPPVTYLKAE